MKTIITTLIIAATLGWGPAANILQFGQGNVALANANTINRAAQLAAIEGKPFELNGQNALAVIEGLHGLGYLSAVDAGKMQGTVGRLEPTGTFGAWSEVEFTVSGR